MFDRSAQNILLSSTRFVKQRQYWLDKLAEDIEETIILPENQEDQPEEAPGNRQRIKIDLTHPADLHSRLIKLSKNSELSLYIILLTALKTLIYRYTASEDITVISPLYKNALSAETINDCVFIRDQVHGLMTVKELLLAIRNSTLQAYENQDYPSHKIIEYLYTQWNPSGYNPVSNIDCALTNIHSKQKIEGLTSKIAFIFGWEGNRLSGEIVYNAATFGTGYARQVSAHLVNILAGSLENINAKISGIQYLCEDEKRRLLFQYNNTAADFPRDKTVGELFEEQAARTPDNTALVFEEKRLTFRQLNNKANQLALLLRQKGVERETITAIMVKRSLELILGITAVIKAGGAYLPVEPKIPPNRIAYMLADSHANLLLTQGELVGKIPCKPETINIEDNSTYQGKPTHLKKINTPTDILYVMYTSGTTGKPKGVLISHENIINYTAWYEKAVNLTAGDKALFTASYGFDAVYTQVYASLLKGCTLHVISEETNLSSEKLLKYIKENQITYLKVTPSLLTIIVQGAKFSAEMCQSLRFIITGGEPIKVKDVDTVHRTCPHLKIMNHFGPTETTIGSIAQFINFHRFETYKRNPTIGKPIDNTTVFIVDQDMALLPTGVPGELCIGGLGVGRGYINNQTLTADKFIPRFLQNGEKVYRTGDLARWLPNENIECLGRIDGQVKIRGYRIELEEIERQMLTHPSVEKALLTTKEDKNSDRYICAYIVASKSIQHQGISPAELRQYLLNLLPEYMLPQYFIQLQEIPLTSHNKIDRKLLPDPEFIAEVPDYIPPGDEIEKALVEMWAEVLNVENHKISIDANFFQLGGHSLKATILASRIFKTFNVEIPLVEIFRSPSIKGLAEYIKRERKGILTIKDEQLLRLNTGTIEDNNLFVVHDGTGEIQGYIEFCNHLNYEFNCWGIRADKIIDYTPQNITIEEIAGKYIEKVKKIQALGPYFIAGWSIGGTIAFEMVRQLEQMAEEIAFLAIIDAPPPPTNFRKNQGKFTRESELKWLQQYFPGIMKYIKPENTTGLGEIWSWVVEYLQTNDFDIETVKTFIPEHVIRALANHDNVGIKELIYYLNSNRTLVNARALYIPAGKINTPIHYFAAARSRNIKKDRWNKYCKKSLKAYEIPGDHFSIFEHPGVVEFAKAFNNEIKTG